MVSIKGNIEQTLIWQTLYGNLNSNFKQVECDISNLSGAVRSFVRSFQIFTVRFVLVCLKLRNRLLFIGWLKDSLKLINRLIICLREQSKALKPDSAICFQPKNVNVFRSPPPFRSPGYATVYENWLVPFMEIVWCHKNLTWSIKFWILHFMAKFTSINHS